MRVSYTLVPDGTSDAVLLPILTWVLRQQGVQTIQEQSVDFSRLPKFPNQSARLDAIIDLYPCDVLFVHRDAEAQDPSLRRTEIERMDWRSATPRIPVVPIRMTEAWLLLDDSAIRQAAGNPCGAVDLKLPSIEKLETTPDPKKLLHEALVLASGLNARRKSALQVHRRVRLIPHHIADFSKLSGLAAFQLMQKDIASFVERFRTAIF